MKLSNIQKESEKIKLKKEINEFEDLKAQALLKLGIMTFDKIRKNEIVNEDFKEICEEIKEFDIEIYTKYMQIRSFEEENNKVVCECGYVALKNEKFCPQCGKILIKEEKPRILCPNCNQEIDKDSVFCSCCGNMVRSENVYYEDSKFNFHTPKEEEAYSDVVEYNEELLDVDDKAKEREILEKEGQEFLKIYQDNNIE